jgi:transcriptional regulator with XRE-family HTH domain
MVSVITPDPMVLELRRRIGESSTQRESAEKLGISESMLTLILQHKRAISPTLLEKLDFVTISINTEHAKITLQVRSGQALETVKAIENAMGAK